MPIPQVTFDTKKIQLQCLYNNTENLGYKNKGLHCQKIQDVYGELFFGEILPNRPFTYASYVMSVDGKIAFEDNEVGPLIAKANYLDQDGALADFWILNLLRANCDGIIIGSGTLIKETGYSGSAYDPDLLNARIDAGKPFVPWTVVVTSTGKNIPYSNEVFQSNDIPLIIATSPSGFINLSKEITKDFFELPGIQTEYNKESIAELLKENAGKIAVMVVGKDSHINSSELMYHLRYIGMEKY